MRRLKLLFLLSAFLSAGVMLCASCGDDDDSGSPEFTQHYIVTFDTDGGSAVDVQAVVHDKNASKPDDPKKAGYEFLGWYCNDAEFDFSTSITQNITLKARWKVQYDDVIPAVFSVSNDKKVMFSKGNLQYQTSTKTWRFAEHQYDYCFDQYGMVKDFWIDLFGWGKWLEGQNPVEKDPDPSKYQDGIVEGSLKGESAIGKGWNILSSDEWKYLTGIGNKMRPNALVLRNYVTIKGVPCLAILPDDCNPAKINWDNWQSLESAGAVFLPAAGSRRDAEVGGIANYGFYWSRRPEGDKDAYYLTFNPESYNVLYASRYFGLSVRLVREFWD